MDSTEKDARLQVLAEFLRDAAYSETLFHHTDNNVFVEEPEDENGDVVYSCRLRTHYRVQTPRHFYDLHFYYTATKGIYAVSAAKDEIAVDAAEKMEFEQFQDFVIKLFEIEKLYTPPGKQLYIPKDRAVRSAPTLQSIVKYLDNICVLESGLRHPLKWLGHLVHPRDNNGDLSFSCGIWTNSDIGKPLPKPYTALSISSSQTRGIYWLQAWHDRKMVHQQEKVSFDDFKEYVEKLFQIKSEQ